MNSSSAADPSCRKKYKILIHGSCASRDILNEPTAKRWSLIDYFARSSLAVYASGSVEGMYSLDGIESAFQRRMVERDLGKKFLEFVANADFDLLLLDLIDERFALYEMSGGRFVTVSNEFLKAGIPCAAGRVASGSNEFKKLWEQGAANFFSILHKHGLLHKVRINCVRWAQKLDDPQQTLDLSEGRIQAANDLLEWMYEKIAEFVPADQFLRFDEDLFVGSTSHVWGISPFHYVNAYYQDAVAKIDAELARIASSQTVQQGWRHFNLNQPESVECAESIGRLSDAEIDTQLSGDIAEIYCADEAWHSRFDARTRAAIDVLLGRMGEAGFRDELLRQAVENGRIETPSLFGGEQARCCQSIYVQNRNFLRFEDKNATFFLVQHHKFARAIYFPEQKVVVVVDVIALPKSAVYAMNRELARRLPTYLANGRNSSAARFAGVLATYPRPYHFFYDTLPTLFHCHRHVLPASRWPAIIQFSGGAFLSVAEFLAVPAKQRMFDRDEALNARLAEENGFSLQLGYAVRRDPDFDALDAALIEYGQKKTASDVAFSARLVEAGECSSLIWFGICSEKRSWQEQVDGIVRIIDGLSAQHPGMGVVFDGITSTCPQDCEALRAQSAQKELATVATIIARLARPVRVFDLIGAPASVKLAFAAQITAFLTNFLTDSMYVARVARKLGLAHGAKFAMHSDHQHPNTYFVPKDWVRDDPSAAANWSAVSYSISPARVADLFGRILASADQWKRASFSLHGASKNISLTSLAEGYEVFAQAEGRPEYLSVNGRELRFDALAEDSVPIENGAAIDFYFRGRAAPGVSVSLSVIAHDGVSRCFTATVPLGDSRYIAFPPGARSYRLFVRLKGRGLAWIRRIESVARDALECEPEAIGVLSPSLPARVSPALLRWNQPVFNYESAEIFLSGTEELLSGIHRIAITDKFLEFNFHRGSEPDLLIVFNGNLSRTKNTSLPAFSGMGLVGRLKASILMLNDPSLYCAEDLSLAWYAGSTELPLQKCLPRFLNFFAEKFGPRRVVMYGGSGGGFAVLYYAATVKNSLAVVCNPQTDLTAYNRESVERYVTSCLGGNPQGLPLAEVFEKNGIGYKSAEAFARGDYELVYLQNKLDGHHWDRHLLPFMKDCGLTLKSSGNLISNLNERVTMIVSDQWGSGHKAAPKKFVFGLLEHILSGAAITDSEEFLAGLHQDSMAVLKDCRLQVDAIGFAASVTLAEGYESSTAIYAWYLYKDGSRVEALPYGAEPKTVFETPPENGVYWAVAFLRDGDLKQSLRSNKSYGL